MLDFLFGETENEKQNLNTPIKNTESGSENFQFLS
jgi:hypothetical protein